MKEIDNLKEKNIHFIAIGGVGQSALAKILATRGYKVKGSDITESKYTKSLKSMGIKVSIGHKKENIDKNSIIVLSSAIKDDNPELIEAKRLNLPIFHRSDILKLISDEFDCFIGFCGTHGKTTTSGLCSYILENLNQKPAYAIGGTVVGLDTNANADTESKIFVAELDESDGTIIKYSPDYIVINNLEEDHFDFYKNGKKDLINQFILFIKNLGKSSKLFVNIDDDGIKTLVNNIDKDYISYSIKDKNANYFADEINIEEAYNSFKLYKNGIYISDIKTAIKGTHNVYNALCVIAVLMELGIDVNKMSEYLASFKGMKRRFELVYNKEIKVIDDYAHHPTEIAATLNTAKKQTKNRIVAIFQPHRYTRLKALWNEFMQSFDMADNLFVVDTYSAGDKFDNLYNSENFAKEIHHKNVMYIKGSMEDAAKEISKYIKKDDFVITIGAGDITKIGHSLGEYYEKR